MNDFFQYIEDAVGNGQFIKLTLSKPFAKSSKCKNIFIKPAGLKDQDLLSFVFRFETKDETRNYRPDESLEIIKQQLSDNFRNATLVTAGRTFDMLSNKKGNVKILNSKNDLSIDRDPPHDRQKNKRIDLDRKFLFHLGITAADGKLIPKMADKYRQINKYLEIVEGLIKGVDLPENFHIVDMGSGKGYLTFALYDFLKNISGLNVHVLGIELREELVEKCNTIASQLQFEQLQFASQRIEDFEESQQIDILIALHACDTATDDAIAKGILSKAKVIVSAPCCHKQIRQSLKGKSHKNPLLKYGIFQERQFEMVTDTIRALIMEDHGYQSKIFEFISNEHTRKNIMLVGTQQSKLKATDTKTKIEDIKSEYGIDNHYLEELMYDKSES